MTVIVVVIAFLVGAAAGAAILWHLLPARLRQHVDYKQRWEDAIGLLGSQGQLTREQVDSLTVQAPIHPPAAEPAFPVTPVQPSTATLRALRSMASWDRKDVEIARASRGLPPVDDLVGMATWDKKAVLKARAEAGTG